MTESVEAARRPDHELSPNERVRVVTESGSIYHIATHGIVAGLLESTVEVIRSEDSEAPTQETLEKAAILGDYAVSKIFLGEPLQVIGLDAVTSERRNYRTSPVLEITKVEDSKE